MRNKGGSLTIARYTPRWWEALPSVKIAVALSLPRKVKLPPKEAKLLLSSSNQAKAGLKARMEAAVIRKDGVSLTEVSGPGFLGGSDPFLEARILEPLLRMIS